MPVIFLYRGIRFYFFANEGTPREPVHIHVEGGGAAAKIWLAPQPEVAYNRGFSASLLRELLQVATFRRKELEDAWNDFFAS